MFLLHYSNTAVRKIAAAAAVKLFITYEITMKSLYIFWVFCKLDISNHSNFKFSASKFVMNGKRDKSVYP